MVLECRLGMHVIKLAVALTLLLRAESAEHDVVTDVVTVGGGRDDHGLLGLVHMLVHGGSGLLELGGLRRRGVGAVADELQTA